MNSIPQNVRDFLTEKIDSAEQLETLLLLFRERERPWDADAVSQSIYTVPQSASRTLETLETRGLAASNGGSPPAWRYAPATPAVDALVGELAAVYRERRAAVITFLYSRPADPVQSFADAFKLRKDR